MSDTSKQELIEEAAKAIGEVTYTTSSDQVRAARAAFAVFEKAHTPTDDEREAAKAEAVVQFPSSSIARRGFITGWLKRAALRRTAVQEPSAGHMDALARIDQAIAYVRASWLGNGEPTRNTPAGEIIAILRGVRTFESEPQGEPTDAEVAAAMRAYAEITGFTPNAVTMRAALRAAYETRGEGR